MFAAQHELDNVIAFTDYNKLQLDGEVSEICDIAPLDDKWRAFGWNVLVVDDGHDCEAIDAAITSAKSSRKPSMIILNTVKGKGVSFAEAAGTSNHSMQVAPETMAAGLAELRGEA